MIHSPLLLLAQPTDGLADIRDPWRMTDWMFWGVVAAGAALALLVGWWLYRRHRARKARRPVGPPPIPPGEWARQALDRLATESDAYSDENYSVAVSQIVREYIERAFELPAPERTTEEFLAEISGHRLFTDEMRASMGTFLERCDLVKFAGQQLPPGERPRLLENARTFVRSAERGSIASTTPAA